MKYGKNNGIWVIAIVVAVIAIFGVILAFGPQVGLSFAAANSTQIAQMESALGAGYTFNGVSYPPYFTNISLAQTTLGSVSTPGVLFTAYDSKAYINSGQGGGYVLVVALPLGDELGTWNATSPSTYSFTTSNGAAEIGTITFTGLPAADYFGGQGSGHGNFVTWKEIIPIYQYQSQFRTAMTAPATTVSFGGTTSASTTVAPTTIASTTAGPTTAPATSVNSSPTTVQVCNAQAGNCPGNIENPTLFQYLEENPILIVAIIVVLVFAAVVYLVATKR